MFKFINKIFFMLLSFSGSLATIRDIAEISNGDIPDII